MTTSNDNDDDKAQPALLKETLETLTVRLPEKGPNEQPEESLDLLKMQDEECLRLSRMADLVQLPFLHTIKTEALIIVLVREVARLNAQMSDVLRRHRAMDHARLRPADPTIKEVNDDRLYICCRCGLRTVGRPQSTEVCLAHDNGVHCMHVHSI